MSGDEMTYEYKILKTENPNASEEQLNNDFGRKGWLLVQILEWDGEYYYYFARPKNCH